MCALMNADGLIRNNTRQLCGKLLEEVGGGETMKHVVVCNLPLSCVSGDRVYPFKMINLTRVLNTRFTYI